MMNSFTAEMQGPDIHVKDCLKNTVMKCRFKGVKVFKLRLLAGTVLIKLAALIMGVGIEIEDNSDE